MGKIDTVYRSLLSVIKSAIFSVFRGDEIPLLRMPGGLVTKAFFEENGFNLPIMVDKKEGLGMTVPPPSFTIQDVEDHVGESLIKKLRQAQRKSSAFLVC